MVVRHLPCQLTEERLFELLTPLPPHDYMYFVQGDVSYNLFGYSRLYINFTNEDDIVPFKEAWDGYVFEDEAGGKAHAVVEFAPFQRIPRKNKRKQDPKCGTIETDPEFVAFAEAYEQDVEPLPSIDKTTYMLEEPKAATKVTTALIEYLKDKKEQRARARAAKEAKRREKKAKEKTRKEKVEPEKTSSHASLKVMQRQGGKGGGSGERGGGSKPVSATQSSETKGMPLQAPSTVSSGQEASSTRQSSQQRDYGDEASVRVIARPGGGGGGGGRRSSQPSEKGRQKYGSRGEKEFSESGAVKKTESYPSVGGGKDDSKASQPQGGGEGERRERGGRGRGGKRPDQVLYNPRGRRDGGEGEEAASGSYRGRGSGRPYYGRGRGRGGRGGGQQRYSKDKPQT